MDTKSEMTRDEILNMEAGPELDALVGKHVMGIDAKWVDGCRCPDCGASLGRITTNIRARCVQCNEWKYSAFKCYSHEIADAWEVLAAMAERDIYFVIETLSGGRAAVDCLRVGWEYSTVTGPAPLAICRAALIATLESARR